MLTGKSCEEVGQILVDYNCLTTADRLVHSPGDRKTGTDVISDPKKGF